MRRIACLPLSLAIALHGAVGATAAAQDAGAAPDIAIALTDERVDVDTGFTGATLTLFGAVSGVADPTTVDIIAIVSGPQTRFLIRKLEQRNLIWTPGAPRRIDNAPGLYISSATRPIGDIAPLPDQAAFRLGADHLTVSVAAPRPEGANAEGDDGDAASEDLYRNAFLTEIEELGLYRDAVGGVDFKKGGLFAVNVDLPATTPVGEYSVAVYLYRDGLLLGQDAATLSVNKVGLERQIYDLAHERPVTYGLLCVAMSLIAGWAASVAFRK